MPGDLTERQELVLTEIGKHMRDQGIAPTIREMMAATGISSTSVTVYHVRKLGRAGYIRRSAELARGIVLTEAGAAWLAERGIHVDPVRDKAQADAIEAAARLVIEAPTKVHLKALERALEAVA